MLLMIVFDINKAAEFEERIHFLEHKLKTEMEKTNQEIDNYQIKITDQNNMIYYQNQQIAELQRHLASEISRIQDESKRKVHEVSALVGGQKSTITALEKKLSESDKCNRMLQKEITRLNAQLTAAKNNSQQHKQEVQTNRVTEEVNHLFSKIISKNSKEIKVVENKNNDFKKSWAVKTKNNPAIPAPIKSSELKIVNRPKIPISKSMINLQDTQELVIKRSISLCDMNNVRDDFEQWLINYKTHRLEILKRVKARWMFLAGKLLDQLSNRVKKAQLRGSKMFSVSIKKANESPPIVRRNSARLTKNQLIEQLRNERRLQLNQSEMNSIWVFDNQLPSRRALPDPARLT
ncbi:hypothetical protein BC833DRAFT_289096 [Globomyces pollinis-pini]|nr:hypothetical protein BC833DRAFT_289096 [Globomyces pollinis-pini]